MIVSTAGFWAAVAIVALGAAIIVRTSRRDPSTAPPFDRVFALMGVVVGAGVVGLVATMSIGADQASVGDRLSALAETIKHSPAMLGATAGAVLAWCYALAYVLVSGTRAR